MTSVSVTARPVVLTAEVAGTSANEGRGSIDMAGNAAIPISSLRRSGDFRPGLISSDMSTPFLFIESRLVWGASLGLSDARIRKIAYVAPQNSDVDFRCGVCGAFARDFARVRSKKWQGGSG